MSPWAKFYRKDIIDNNNIKFRLNLKLGEDSIFNYQYISKIDKIIIVGCIGYKYYQNYDSATHCYSENRYEEYMKWGRVFREIAPERDGELAQLGIRLYLHSLKTEFCNAANKGAYYERRKKALKLRRSKEVKQYFDDGNIFKLKKELILFAFFAKYNVFFVCDCLLKLKEIMRIRVK